MTKDELAKKNHLFFIVRIPHAMFKEDFQRALFAAHNLMKEIRIVGREPCLDDFQQFSFEGGYLGLSAPAAEVILEKGIDLGDMARSLYFVLTGYNDAGAMNEEVSVSVSDNSFVFSIIDYETNDPQKGWVNVTDNPLSVPGDQTLDRRVIISLA